MTAVRQDLDLNAIERSLRRPISGSRRGAATQVDHRDGAVFLADAKLRLAIRVALATGRPLLLRGLPGTGKSTVAAFVARRLRWRYYEQVMTSETQATDLLWRYDAVRRLADAQTAGARAALATERERAKLVELPAWDYIDPGPLWWAQSPRTARLRGAPVGQEPATRAMDVTGAQNSRRSDAAAVVLIDEIDKAEPSVPNALLVPLGSQTFVVEPTGVPITVGETDAGQPLRLLVVITTNEERRLPRAFIRRCVVHTMPLPDPARLVQIAAAHVRAAGRPMTASEKPVCKAIADRVRDIQDELRAQRKRPPGTAEFLDAWNAARELGLTPTHRDWELVEQASLRKEFTDLLEPGL